MEDKYKSLSTVIQSLAQQHFLTFLESFIINIQTNEIPQRKPVNTVLFLTSQVSVKCVCSSKMVTPFSSTGALSSPLYNNINNIYTSLSNEYSLD